MQEINGGQVLITGGGGVIGSYVIDALKDEFDLVVADKVKPEADVKFVNIDLTEPFSISKDFESCVHLAALVGGIQFFTKHPVENLRDNPRMVTNLLDTVTNSNVNHVIYTSSSVVYQHQTQYPTPEESVSNSPPPTSAYGMSKLVGEHICKAYNEQFGLNYTVLRPFNAYGPREAPDPEYAHVIPELIRKVLSGQNPVELYGSGEQTRTFTHGKDIGRAFYLAIKNKNSINETFNVSGNEEIKIIDLLRKIWRISSHKEELKIKHLEPLPHDVPRRFPSNKKIEEKLGWKPQILFDEGLLETMKWIKEKYFSV
ncbi:MAG: NAD-dependent epimerase/dehydratase family protein [Thaumarchaeota archaeon]|nr:NAD-dependent epimerase/dehydratase family protein [Nitrososphaerota archaeon]